MRSKERSSLNWVLFIVIISLLLISESKGSASQSPTASPPKFEASPPKISPKLQSMPPSITPEASNEQTAPSATISAKNLSFLSPAISPVLIANPANHEKRIPVAAPSQAIDKAPIPPKSKESSSINSRSSPAASLASNDTKALPNAHAPSASSPAISPVTHEENTTSNIVTSPPKPPIELHNSSSTTIQAPFPSNPQPSILTPLISPMPHEVIVPSNDTPPLPVVTSPAKSPASHEETNSQNITHAPLASKPKFSALVPTLSPSINPISSVPSHPLPLDSPPTISPTPHDIVLPSNVSHGPLAARISPVISPIPHEVNTHSPETSSLPLNITHAPSSSHLSPSISPPSNTIFSPLPSHIRPSLSSPVISPTPHEVKQPSNVTHSPLPSLLNPRESPPALSPVPHVVKDPSNATHVSPLLSPLPHEVKNVTNTTHELAPATSIPRHDASAPLPHSPLSSEHPEGTKMSPSMPHGPAEPPISYQKIHTPSPSDQDPQITPVETPSNLPMPPKDSQTDHAFSPKSQDHSISSIQPPFASPNREATVAPSPSKVIPSRHDKYHSISPIQPPFASPNREVTVAPSPSKVIPAWHDKSPFHPPILPPPPQSIWALPPPPPNLDCKFLSCQEPMTYPTPGSLCVCVIPIKVGLRVNITLFTFFPLVTELAQEIASGIFMKQSQVRIMGANADAEDPEKTILLIDLVPLGRSFDINTALLVYARFWQKRVLIKDSYFGVYDVLYIDYPGLPPSPPMAPGDVSVDGGTFTNGNARAIKPIGVDVRKKKEKLSGTLIAIIILSSVIALVISIGTMWILLAKYRNSSSQPPPTSEQSLLSDKKPSGSRPPMLRSGPSSTSTSFTSSIAAGSAKTFSLAEIEKATNKFHDSRIIGEGGFGRVYQGTLEDGTMVAVKVLKRNDPQGGREFMAEVEMLSRLHHRNLVKLIGICIEDTRCLVYELIPNGSVESHLHGLDKMTSPLDWNERMKIALGAARGLAYLHEDSSPRVIHRDFKSSNILLEHDYTPKVSDFGLARAALDEGNDHISTQVMGTFGYVAPEYAMTGHLLVKSDVYSYGVVLLELLTSRKPVDMSQPPGQETLVNWARPLLSSTEGLEKLIDPSLVTSVSMDTVAKVAAIASMCVQPEVSHRPFMGEVVQALKLVCNETDDGRRSFSQDESSNKELDVRINVEERMLSESDIFCSTCAAFGENDASGPFQRDFSSGPIQMGRSEKLWDRVKEFSSGSMMKKGEQWH